MQAQRNRRELRAVPPSRETVRCNRGVIIEQRHPLPCPSPSLPAEPVLLPERPVSQPAARLPAVKVTLPAAMYYTGVHSQAEYNIALEGGWNFCCRLLPEPGGRVGMKGATADFFFSRRENLLFSLDGFALCLWFHVMRELFSARMSAIAACIGKNPQLSCGRQPSRMSHNIPDGRTKGEIGARK